jgi:hypothetical protein
LDVEAHRCAGAPDAHPIFSEIEIVTRGYVFAKLNAETIGGKTGDILIYFSMFSIHGPSPEKRCLQ